MAITFASGSGDWYGMDAATSGIFDPIGSAWTILFWVKTTSAGTNDYMFTPFNTSGNGVLGCIQENTHIRIFIRNTSANIQLNYTSTFTFNDGAWHLICVKQDSSGNLKLFKDSTKETASSGTTGTVVPNKCQAGRFGSTGSTEFVGTMAHLCLFFREITEGELASVQNGLLPSHLGPDNYWPFWLADSSEQNIGTWAASVSASRNSSPVATSIGKTNLRLLSL